MLKQLEELLKLQKELDEAILKEQGIVWDEIYNAYKRKYVINCMRLSGGY